VSKKFLTAISLIASNVLCLAVEISSNNPIEYIANTGELVVKGDARIATDNFVIQADEISFNEKQVKALATGNVKIDNEKIYVVSDYASYDMNSNLVYASHSRTKIHDYYFNVESIESDVVNNLQTGTNAEIFYGPMDSAFVPSIFVKNFEIRNGQSIKTKSTKFKVGPATIFYLPSAEIELTSHPFYLEQDYGVNRTNGVYLQNDFYFGVKKGLKLGGFLDFYTGRGILVGPALKIDTRSEKNQIFSETKFGFIRDGVSVERRGFDIRNKPIPYDRYFLEFAHKQHYDDRIDVIARSTLLSDSEAERDFRKMWYNRNQQPESFVEVAYRGQNCIVSAFGQFEPNNFYNTTQQMPEFRIAYLPTKLLDTKLIHNAHLGIVRLYNPNKDLYGATSSYRSDIYYGISLPLGYKNFFAVKPIFGTRVLVYGRNADEEIYGKGFVQGGFDIDVKFVGRSDYVNETFGIDGLKHVINPTIQYRVIPSGNESDKIPKFHRECFHAEIPSIDLDDMRNVDDLQRQNMIRLGIKNSLYTQSGSYVPRKLMQLDIYQDVLFARNYDSFRKVRQRKFPDTYLMAGIYPISWFSFNLYGKIDPARLHLHKLRTSASIKDADFWELTFFTNYFQFDGVNSQKPTEQYGLSFSFNLSSKSFVSLEMQYDAKNHKFSQQRFSFSNTLGNSWIFNIGITVRTNVKREDHYQLDWHLKLLDF
jgi:LPS-assembly protein